MQIVLLLLFISQKLNLVEPHNRNEHFVSLIKRDVHSSSSQNFNRYTKTYEIGQHIIFNAPNFTLVDQLLTAASMNRSYSSIRDHTSWFTSPVTSKADTEIARYDSVENRFILKNNDYTIDASTSQLTLINTNDDHLLYTELSMHAESGISAGDAILHDTYRFVRLSTTSMNCTTNLTVNLADTIDISCTIEYEFLRYDHYQPTINMTFYIKQKDEFMYMPIELSDLNERKDRQIDSNRTLHWKRSISYTIRSIRNEHHHREYLCIVIPDSSQEKNSFEDETRICRTQIHVRNQNSSTITLNRWHFIDVLIITLPILSSLLFIASLILCLITRQSNRKRIVQIKPENKTTSLPLHTKQTVSKANPFSNNNETLLEIPQHKPGCPKYIPSPDSNLLSSDLFTHTTIDNIKKIILPDIPQNNTDLFDDQTYIHFYIPSKTEKISSLDKSLEE